MKRIHLAMGPVLLMLALGWGQELGRSQEKKSPAEFKLSREEKQLLDWANEIRAKNKLPALKPNPILFRVARAHSANMGSQQKLDHVLDGKNPAQRILAAGYDYASVGENIAMTDGLLIKEVQKGWLASKYHREQLLSKKFTETGLGIVRNKKDEYYYTQVFGKRRRKR